MSYLGENPSYLNIGPNQEVSLSGVLGGQLSIGDPNHVNNGKLIILDPVGDVAASLSYSGTARGLKIGGTTNYAQLTTAGGFAYLNTAGSVGGWLFQVNNATGAFLSSDGLHPASAGGNSLGRTTLEWDKGFFSGSLQLGAAQEGFISAGAAGVIQVGDSSTAGAMHILDSAGATGIMLTADSAISQIDLNDVFIRRASATVALHVSNALWIDGTGAGIQGGGSAVPFQIAAGLANGMGNWASVATLVSAGRHQFACEFGSMVMASDVNLRWQTTSLTSGLSYDDTDTEDVGLKRASVELLQVTNGVGGYGKLALGGSVPSGIASTVLPNAPTGATPSGWLELNIEGTTAYVPVWT